MQEDSFRSTPVSLDSNLKFGLFHFMLIYSPLQGSCIIFEKASVNIMCHKLCAACPLVSLYA